MRRRRCGWHLPSLVRVAREPPRKEDKIGRATFYDSRAGREHCAYMLRFVRVISRLDAPPQRAPSFLLKGGSHDYPGAGLEI